LFAGARSLQMRIRTEAYAGVGSVRIGRSSKAFALKAANAVEILEGLVLAGPFIAFVFVLIGALVRGCGGE